MLFSSTLRTRGSRLPNGHSFFNQITSRQRQRVYYYILVVSPACSAVFLAYSTNELTK
jgi:hypothetical protein